MTKEIKVKDVLEMLAQGKTREEIGNHYEISKREVKVLFKHPELKGRRTHTSNEVSFVVISDNVKTGEEVTQILDNSSDDVFEEYPNEDNVATNEENVPVSLENIDSLSL